MHTHQDLFRECPIFRLVPPPTALSLVEHFEPVVFVPGEVVIYEGKGNAALFVINRGLVNVWRIDSESPTGRKDLTTLTDNDFFGEQTLLKNITATDSTLENYTPRQANATCQCASYCDMFRLSSEDFLAVIDEARNRHVSWEGKELADILNDAADQRNVRAESLRKRCGRWENAGRAAIRRNRTGHDPGSLDEDQVAATSGIQHSGTAVGRFPFCSARCQCRCGHVSQPRDPVVVTKGKTATLESVVDAIGASTKWNVHSMSKVATGLVQASTTGIGSTCVGTGTEDSLLKA